MGSMYACRFCDYGPRNISAAGQHFDTLLSDFRKARLAKHTDARDANTHPLHILQFARQSIHREYTIHWTPLNLDPTEKRVLHEFSSRVFVEGADPISHNPFYKRCPPEWWMGHLHRITQLYQHDQNFEEMTRLVEDVMLNASGLMNEVGYLERAPARRLAAVPVGRAARTPAPQRIMIGPKLSGSGNRGDLNALDVHGNRGRTNAQIAPAESDDDDCEEMLPPLPPHRNRHRSRGDDNTLSLVKNRGLATGWIGRNVDRLPKRKRDRKFVVPPAAEVVDIMSSPPPGIKGEEESEGVIEDEENLSPVLFTLGVDVMGAHVAVGVTVGMGLQDAVRMAVRDGLMVSDSHAGAFAFKGPNGDIWGDERWIVVCKEAIDTRMLGDAWSVRLVRK